MGLARVAARARRRPLGLPLRAAQRRAAPGRPPSAPRRAAPAAARPSSAGASHFVGSSARSGWAPPSRSSRDARSLAPAPELRDPGVPAPGPALVPARAPPRRAAAACAAPSSRAGGSVPAAGRAVRSAGAAGSGLRGAATEPGLRVAASGRRAGGAGGGGGGGVEGKEGARGEREEGASERRREGRPTSSATIIRLKQVQPLPPCEAASRERGKTTWTKLRGKKSGGLGTRHGAADLKKAGGGETAGMPPGLAKPMAPFASPGLSLESGGTAKLCSHTVHWFPAGCARRGEWPGAWCQPGSFPASLLLPFAWGLGVGFLNRGWGRWGSSSGLCEPSPRARAASLSGREFPIKCSVNQ